MQLSPIVYVWKKKPVRVRTPSRRFCLCISTESFDMQSLTKKNVKSPSAILNSNEFMRQVSIPYSPKSVGMSANQSKFAQENFGTLLFKLSSGQVMHCDFHPSPGSYLGHTMYKIIYSDTQGSKYKCNVLAGEEEQLLKLIKMRDIDYCWYPRSTFSIFQQGYLGLLGALVVLVMFPALFWTSRLKVRIPQDAVQAVEFAKSKASAIQSHESGVGFVDVAGNVEAVKNLKEIVEYLKNPSKFLKVGAKPPRGILLVGPPGTGKTLLARAVAGEAGIPFFTVSGSEFVEVIVGVGAARVRDIFSKARLNAPCIVFIDEIDSVGGNRSGPRLGSGGDEREQTLNQLLTEMDGFDSRSGVLFIAATNRVDLLDAALLRPGRFDRQFPVPLPSAVDRAAILEIHSKNKKVSPDVNLSKLAMNTSGFSGADLANLMDEACLVALRRCAHNDDVDYQVTNMDLHTAKERVTRGIERPSLPESSLVRYITAYYEAGKAVVSADFFSIFGSQIHPVVEKVSIRPRGNSTSQTTLQISHPEISLYNTQTMESLECSLISTLAGRASEEFFFGVKNISNVGQDDLAKAYQIANDLQFVFGVSIFPPVHLFGPHFVSFRDHAPVLVPGSIACLDRTTDMPLSDITKARSRHLPSNEAMGVFYQITMMIVKMRSVVIRDVAECILKNEELLGDDLIELLSIDETYARFLRRLVHR